MPKLKANILILSASIRSGKTTQLLSAFAGKQGVSGFLTPDRDGQRRLYDLSTAMWYPFEIPQNSDEAALEIGRFRFAESAFAQAKKLLEQDAPLCIVDEVGKLEVLHHRGLEPELSALIAAYQNGGRKGVLLLVIRDTLLAEAVRKYHLEDVPVSNAPQNLVY